MSATLVTAAVAGWYHDPSDSGSWRWWDGATWTSHVRPKEETASVAVVQPVAVEPVAVVEPVAQPVLPQPAQPIQPIPPVSLTPATPTSEQEYWHSPGAEVVQIPGRSRTSHSSYSSMHPAGNRARPYNLNHEWGDVGSPQTPGIWLLAAMPLMTLGLAIALSTFFGFVQGTTGATLSMPNIVFSVASVVASWVFAGLDIKALGRRGYRAPKIWWMLLLPPLAYFIARGKAVRREGQRAWPPELLYFLSVLVGFLIVAAAVVMLLSVMGVIPGVQVF